MTIRGAVDGGGLTGAPTTIIDGQDAHRVLQCVSGEGAGASTPGDSEGYLLIIPWPALTNCTFRGNSAEYRRRDVQRFDSSPTLMNCTFTGNSAELRRRDVQL